MYQFETNAIHAGQPPDELTGAVTLPIHLATTYAQLGVNDHRGFEYSRTGNPTRQALETVIAELEGMAHGFAFSSGMAAEDAVLRLLRPGDNVLLSSDAYGGTFRLINKVYGRIGVTWTTVDLTNPADVDAKWNDSTKIVWLETPTNPNLRVVNIEAVADRAHKKGGLCVVDNTFATPYLQQPGALGADVVVHSATKYIGGHSDVVGGLAVTDRDDLAEHLRATQNSTGAVISPFDCYMLLRGLKTLPVRMGRHCENAKAITTLLLGHDAVERVMYPGLPDHPGHDAAKAQMRDFGGMISFIPVGGAEAANRIATTTQLFTLAESLGAVESLIEIPAGMTHGSTAGSPLEVDPALVRLSVGIEHVDDLAADLMQALD